MDARTQRLGLALLVLLALSTAAQATEKPDPRAPGLSGTERLEALMNRVRLEQQAVKTLEARFVQNRESSLLVAAEQSTGTFSYAVPGRVRWEYTSPNPISVLIQGEQMTTWYHDLKRADLLKIGKYSNQVFKYLGASGNMDALTEYFTVRLTAPPKAGVPYQMELIPRFSRISKRIKSMTLWIDDQTFFPEHLKYVQADGDTVEYQFTDMKRNAPIPDDRFVLKLPPGISTRVLSRGQEGSAKG